MGGGCWHAYERDSLTCRTQLRNINFGSPAYAENDLEVRDLLEQSGVSYVVVATKSDKISRASMARQRVKFEETFGADGKVPLFTFSAVTNQGRKELWSVIEKHVLGATRAPKAQ